MRARTLLPLLLALLTATGGVLAQPSFGDVAEGHWAGDAVERIADLGIVVGHPDGSYRGDEAFTRYQAALVVARLLDVIDRTAGATATFSDDDVAAWRDAAARFGGRLAELDARVASLEGADVGGADAVRVVELERRVETLSAEVERLREALAGVRPTPGPVGPRAPERPPGSSGPEGPPGPTGPAGAAGAAGRAGASGEVAAGPASKQEPDAAPRTAEGTETRAEPAAPRAERRPAYLGVAAVSESNDRVPVRLIAGYDELLGPVGLRATIDYGRQSPSDARALTVAAHLTYAYPLGDGRVRGYLGAGGGVQLDAADSGQATEGAFAGGLLGLELGLVGPTVVFVEAMVDAYLNEPAGAPDGAYGRLYPTVTAGIAVRF